MRRTIMKRELEDSQSFYDAADQQTP